MIPRIQMDDTVEDRAAIQAPIKEVMTYPLSQFDGKMKTYDYSKLPSIGEKPTPTQVKRSGLYPKSSSISLRMC